MNQLLILLRCLTAVSLRRVRKGPRHPAWSLLYEVGVEACAHQISYDEVVTPRGRVVPAPTPIPPNLRKRLRFERRTLAGREVEQHTPEGWQPGGQVLLYLHGGGYFACTPGTHRAMIARISVATGARCIAPSYRLAPEHPFPAGIDDCVAVYRAVLADGVDAERLFVGGDSAGGGLTLAVLQRLRSAAAALPRAVLLLSPWVDLEASEGSVVDNAAFDYLPTELFSEPVRKYVGSHSVRDPLISALHADLRGLPPMWMLSGALELFVDQNRAFARRAQEQGVSMTHVVEPNMVHVFPLLADVSAPARRSFEQMAEFLAAHR